MSTPATPPPPTPGRPRRWWLWVSLAALFLAAWPGWTGMHLRQQRHQEETAGHAEAGRFLPRERTYLILFDLLIVTGTACFLKDYLGGHQS